MSYVVVKAEKAKELGLDLLERVQTARTRDLEELDKKLLEEEKNNFWRKLLRQKPRDLESLRKLEQQQPGWMNRIWNITVWRYHEHEELAKRIIAASRIGDPIHLSLEDVEML